MTEEMELICFQLIANSGAAKSSFVEAIQVAKKGLFEDAKAKLVEAEEALLRRIKFTQSSFKKKRAEKNRIFITVYACRRPNGFNRNRSIVSARANRTVPR